MAAVVIRDMDEKSEYFVGTCSHVGESGEIDASAAMRIDYLKNGWKLGLRVKVAFLNQTPVGFLYLLPIDISPWGPLGKDLNVIPCLYITEQGKGEGIGRALLSAAESESRRAGAKGIVTYGYYNDFWFMPASYFEKIGFTPVQRRGTEALLWKVLDASAEPPQFMTRKYEFKPVADRIVVDLFWNQFCQTSSIEARRVREVASEFGSNVILNEYPAEDPVIRASHNLARGIFVNGREIGWGYEAPREGIHDAINEALKGNLSRP
jgi:GNAT superfamily N-acetyltransferase